MESAASSGRQRVWITTAETGDVLGMSRETLRQLRLRGVLNPGKHFRRWSCTQGRVPLQWHLDNVEATITGWSRRHRQHGTPSTGRSATSLQVVVNGRRRSLTQSEPQGDSADANQLFPQAIGRWGNSLAVRLPADCLRQAGLQEGDEIDIVVGPDGRLSLEPLRRLDRSALATDLRQLQATMPLTPAVIEDCRAGERW